MHSKILSGKLHEMNTLTSHFVHEPQRTLTMPCQSPNTVLPAPVEYHFHSLPLPVRSQCVCLNLHHNCSEPNYFHNPRHQQSICTNRSTPKSLHHLISHSLSSPQSLYQRTTTPILYGQMV